MNPSSHWLPIGWIVLALLAGCTVGPDYRAPAVDVAAHWQEIGGGATTLPVTQPSQAVSGSLTLVEWWTAFDDPALNELIAAALRANLDLQQAQERVLEARFRRAGTEAGLFPQVEVDATAEHVRLSKNGIPIPTGGGTSAGASGLVARPDQAGGSSAVQSLFTKSELNLYQAGFDASWGLDAFGGIRRNIEASNADLAAAVEDRRSVMVTLLAEVARNYVELRGAQRQVAIAQANLESQRQTLQLTQQRRRVGMTTDLDVSRASAEVNTTESQLPLLLAQERQSIHALAVLLGVGLEALSPEMTAALAREKAVPRGPAQVPVGLPSELLRRRPDVRRAERQLAASTARIGVAVADLYPKFSLTGNFGFQSLTFNQWAEYASRTFGIGPAVSWPIFDFGRIRANIGAMNSEQRQALAHYQSTILGALREVEDALSLYSAEQVRRASLDQAVQDNRLTVNLSMQLYTQGAADFLSVLDAERSLYASEEALAESDKTVGTDLVALYKALGGGWEIEAQVR